MTTADERREQVRQYNLRLKPKNYTAMSADDFRTRLEALGLTQTGLAKVLDIDPRSVRRYCAGSQRVTTLVAWALRGVAAEVERQETLDA